MLNNDKWNEELAKIVAILNKAPLEKAIKWGAEVYTYKGKNVVSYGGFKNHFAIWFNNGVFLSDKYNVLISSNEKTKSLRQWRFNTIEEIDENKIFEYVMEAIEVEKRGERIAPDKFQPVPLPQFLIEYLASDDNLKNAFDQLTPGKQKEYVLYLNEAKQEVTKLARLDKIKPLILDGIGLNDKYRKSV